MFKRFFFLLGLLLGVFAAFRLRLLKSRPRPAVLPDLRDLLTDAFFLCDSAGTVVEANAPARVLFGAGRLPALRYPTGQLVPPGQHPLHPAFAGRETSGTYACTAADGSERVLDVMARPLPDSGVAAVFRDVTAQHESQEREREAQTRQAVVQTLCRRLGLAQTVEAVAQAAAEETHALLRDWPEVQIKVFTFDPTSDTLTCLASAPSDRPKWPRSAAEARPQTIRFDAQVPELWQMYVARKPAAAGLPLISGGVAIGHLSVTSTANVFEDRAVRETAELIASLAALALTAPTASVQTSAYAAQAAAVREIAAALISAEPHALADKVTECVKRVTRAEVCTLSVPVGRTLCVMGEAYKDDLLLPQTAPDDPYLHGTSRKAWRTQKTVTHLGLPPAGQAGPWRVFAGGARAYSAMALPLMEHRGVLTVYTQGDKPLPDMQRKFLETVAALLSLSPLPAKAQEDGAD